MATNIVRLADRQKKCSATGSELRELLEQAERGEIIGVAFAVLKPYQRYEIGYTGQFLEYPDAGIAPVYRLLKDLSDQE